MPRPPAASSRLLASAESDSARLETSRAVHERALARFGERYRAEWARGGPRFRNGLASGDRVTVRYWPLGVSLKSRLR